MSSSDRHLYFFFRLGEFCTIPLAILCASECFAIARNNKALKYSLILGIGGSCFCILTTLYVLDKNIKRLKIPTNNN